MYFSDILKRALVIRKLYEQLEQKKGKVWSKEEIAMGFVGDVGDLMKLVMAAEGVREIPDHKQKLVHELADCLWSVCVLADQYGIDIEEAFMQTMNELEKKVKEQLKTVK